MRKKASMRNIRSVISDDEDAAHNAFFSFVARGHRKIAMFRQENKSFSQLLRKESFEHAFSGLPECRGIFSEDFSLGELTRLLRKEHIIGYLLPCEGFGRKLMHLAKQLHLSIPGELSVVVWENPTDARFFDPPLTTMEQNYESMADAGLTLLEQIFAGERNVPRTVKIPYLFTDRGSVATPSFHHG